MVDREIVELSAPAAHMQMQMNVCCARHAYTLCTALAAVYEREAHDKDEMTENAEMIGLELISRSFK